VRRLADHGLTAWQEVLEHNYEGLVAKDPESRYVGGRSLWWLGVKQPQYREIERGNSTSRSWTEQGTAGTIAVPRATGRPASARRGGAALERPNADGRKSAPCPGSRVAARIRRAIDPLRHGQLVLAISAKDIGPPPATGLTALSLQLLWRVRRRDRGHRAARNHQPTQGVDSRRPIGSAWFYLASPSAGMRSAPESLVKRTKASA
jgi:hypothetical protein